MIYTKVITLNAIYNFVLDTFLYEIIFVSNILNAIFWVFQTTLDSDMVYTKVIDLSMRDPQDTPQGREKI